MASQHKGPVWSAGTSFCWFTCQRIDVRLEEWKWHRNISGRHPDCNVGLEGETYSSTVRANWGEVMGEIPAMLASGWDWSPPLKGQSHGVMGCGRRGGGSNAALYSCLVGLIWRSGRSWNFRIDDLKVSAFYSRSINPPSQMSINVYFCLLSQAAASAA